MDRRVFFIFDYENDVTRANRIRMRHDVIAAAPAGFFDASFWERAKQKGDAAVMKLIDDALPGTTVTVVLIGENTSECSYLEYEVQKSLENGNGLLGIFIDGVPNVSGEQSSRGKVPAILNIIGCPIHEWNEDQFIPWLEDAAARAGHPTLSGIR
jgi:hypothetical protein